MRNLLLGGLVVAAIVVPGSAFARSPVADVIQDAYGNTTNERPSGHGVLPSLAPGPWACANTADCSEGVYAGGTVGEWRQDLADDGLINDSTTRASFANRDDRDLGGPGDPIDRPNFAT